MREWRSIASARSSLLALLVIVAPTAAQARLRVAVLPVEGPQGDKVTRALHTTVKKTADLVPASEWEASAKKLFATSHSSSDIAAVAGDLSVQVVITGKVKKTDEGWELSMSVRHGPTGKAAVKLKYPLKGPRVDAGTLRKLEDEVPPALDTASAGPPGNETPETPEVAPNPGETAPSAEDENPLAKKKQAEAQKPESGARPPWAPWFEASFGFVFGGRSFGFDDPIAPTYHATGPGIELDGTGYPLSYLAERKTTAANLLSGLGAGFTWGADFMGDVTPCRGTDASGGCPPTVDHYATHAYHYEAGVRWRWNAFMQPQNYPEFLFQLQFGERAFNIQRRNYLGDGGERDIGPPDVDYQYITLGAGVRVPFLDRFAGTFLFNYHIVTGTGPVQTTDEWGPGGAYGIRIHAGVEGRIWQGIFASLSGQYEHFGLSFNQPPNGLAAGSTMPPNDMPRCPCGTTGGASDTYWNVTVAAGYRY